MAYRLSRRMRLIFAILLAVVLYVQQLYMTASQFGGNILALNMPTILGKGVPSIFVVFMVYWFLGIQSKPSNFSLQRFFAKRKQSSKEDDWAYFQATSEIEASSQDKGIWGRAIAESNGTDGIAKTEYIKLRVARLLSERKLAEPEPAFEEDEESKKSRKYWKHGWIGIGIVLVGAVIFLVVEINSPKKAVKPYAFSDSSSKEKVTTASKATEKSALTKEEADFIAELYASAAKDKAAQEAGGMCGKTLTNDQVYKLAEQLRRPIDVLGAYESAKEMISLAKSGRSESARMATAKEEESLIRGALDIGDRFQNDIRQLLEIIRLRDQMLDDRDRQILEVRISLVAFRTWQMHGESIRRNATAQQSSFRHISAKLVIDLSKLWEEAGKVAETFKTCEEPKR